MLNKKVILLLFVLLAIVQLYVPAKMILDREEILTGGTEFKFKTAPIDPSDPFRGRYITLYFDEIRVSIDDLSNWQEGEKVYALLDTDKEGYAMITSAQKEPPPDGSDYLATRVQYIVQDSQPGLSLELPFNRYYMEEFKAPAAEQAYIEANRDTTQTAYALVSVKEGEAVLKNVFINEQPIERYIENYWEENMP